MKENKYLTVFVLALVVCAFTAFGVALTKRPKTVKVKTVRVEEEMEEAPMEEAPMEVSSNDSSNVDSIDDDDEFPDSLHDPRFILTLNDSLYEIYHDGKIKYYHNERYGMYFKIDKVLTKHGGEPTNGDGMYFTSEDEKIMVNTNGRLLGVSEPYGRFETFRDAFRGCFEVLKYEHWKITSAVCHKRRFVFRGKRGAEYLYLLGVQQQNAGLEHNALIEFAIVYHKKYEKLAQKLIQKDAKFFPYKWWKKKARKRR